MLYYKMLLQATSAVWYMEAFKELFKIWYFGNTDHCLYTDHCFNSFLTKAIKEVKM